MLLESKKIGLMPLHRLNCVYLYYIIYYNDNPDYPCNHLLRNPCTTLESVRRSPRNETVRGYWKNMLG